MSKPMTVMQVADYLGVHSDTIYTMVKQRQIPHFRVRRRILFSYETINAWINEQEVNSHKEVIS